MTADASLILRQQTGSLGKILLNRPRALNALNQAMVDGIISALEAWRDDASVATVLIHSTSEKGLCAGGDVRAVRQMVLDGKGGEGDHFFASEYHMNALIADYPKPIISLMDGITMGGGVGIGSHASHRLVTERTKLAMPESAIGFFCDVGGTYLLSRAPAGIGKYIGLTGTPISGGDAIFAKLADGQILSGEIEALVSALENSPPDQLDTILEKFIQPRQTSDLETRAQAIAQIFSANSVDEIMMSLEADESEWATKTVKTLASRSPFSLSVIYQAITNARTCKTLNEALAIELTLAKNMIRTPDFIEGVRAVLVDKDQAPKWTPPTLPEVSMESVAAMFTPREAS